MIDGLPKIIKEDNTKKSEDIAKKEMDKIHKIISGELKSSEIVNTVYEEKISTESPETEEEKNRAKPVDGGTWHDRYYGNKDDTK